MMKTYVRRAALMLLIALPLSILVAVLLGFLNKGETASVGQLFGFWSGVILLYGTLPALAASLLHTTLVRRIRGTTRAVSAVLAVVLGIAAGGLVAIFVTDRAAATMWGAVIGALYAAGTSFGPNPLHLASQT